VGAHRNDHPDPCGDRVAGGGGWRRRDRVAVGRGRATASSAAGPADFRWRRHLDGAGERADAAKLTVLRIKLTVLSTKLTVLSTKLTLLSTNLPMSLQVPSGPRLTCRGIALTVRRPVAIM
jgi:hypothetical protein